MYMQGKGSMEQTRAIARESGGKATANCVDIYRTLEHQGGLPLRSWREVPLFSVGSWLSALAPRPQRESVASASRVVVGVRAPR